MLFVSADHCFDDRNIAELPSHLPGVILILVESHPFWLCEDL